MIKYHKHKGMESKGKLKLHPISQGHKDKQTEKYHRQEMASHLAVPIPPPSVRVKTPVENKSTIDKVKEFFTIKDTLNTITKGIYVNDKKLQIYVDETDNCFDGVVLHFKNNGKNVSFLVKKHK